MRRLFRLTLACLLLIIACLPGLTGAQTAAATGKTVFVIPVENEIETGLARSLQRAFAQAEAADSAVVVLDIDTLGGRVDAAMEIGEQIRANKVPVIAYVRSKAISAGAYIALNASHIAMAPGSTIGAAEVRTSDGDSADPKVVAFWRSEMIAAAERTNRDTKIAAGMVDRNIEIVGIKQKGELISLSSRQAVEHKLADGEFKTLDDALIHYGYGSELVTTYHASFAEKAARFLTNPLVIPLLLIIGLLGLTVELIVPGHLFPGFVGAGALILYFFGHSVAGFAGWESVILFAVGVVLMVAEIFITGFGIIGALGVLSLGTGVVMAAYDTTYGLKVMLFSFILSVISGLVLFKYFGHLGMWKHLILADQQNKAAGYTPNRSLRHMMYQVGRTLTPLRPAGTAVFHGQRFDVVSEGAFIPVDTEVQIVLIEGTRIVVRRQPAGENTVIPRQKEE